MTDRLPVSAIKEQLIARMAGLVAELVPGARRQGGYWQGPNPTRAKDGRTSFTVWTNGAWKEFDSDEKGDVIDLIAYCRRCPTAEAIRWAKNWLGLTGLAPAAARKLSDEASARAKAKAEQEARERARRQERAADLWMKANPIAAAGPVDIYLKSRGIDLAEIHASERDLRQRLDCQYWGPWPPGPRGHWSGPAMIAPIRQLSGEVTGAHATFLARDGLSKAPLMSPKIMLGTKMGGAVRLTRGAKALPFRDLTPETAEDLVLGEGIETMLSGAVSLPDQRIWAALDLGNIGALPFDRRIKRLIVACERDVKPVAIEQRDKVLQAARDKGFDVVEWFPPWGSDLNETLR